MRFINNANPKVDTLQHLNLLNDHLIGGNECIKFGNIPLLGVRLFVEELIVLDDLATVRTTMVHNGVDVGPILEFTFPIAEGGKRDLKKNKILNFISENWPQQEKYHGCQCHKVIGKIQWFERFCQDPSHRPKCNSVHWSMSRAANSLPRAGTPSTRCHSYKADPVEWQAEKTILWDWAGAVPSLCTRQIQLGAGIRPFFVLVRLEWVPRWNPRKAALSIWQKPRKYYLNNSLKILT